MSISLMSLMKMPNLDSFLMLNVIALSLPDPCSVGICLVSSRLDLSAIPQSAGFPRLVSISLALLSCALSCYFACIVRVLCLVSFLFRR